MGHETPCALAPDALGVSPTCNLICTLSSADPEHRHSAGPEHLSCLLCLLSYCSFAQMLWRLNFLVFFACLVLNNSYMLYYICPMHTIYTVFVYAALAIGPQLNQKNVWIWIK